VERFFAYLTTQLLQRGVHKSVAALEKDVKAWIKNWNEDPRDDLDGVPQCRGGQ
jgi:hypothetical protein